MQRTWACCHGQDSCVYVKVLNYDHSFDLGDSENFDIAENYRLIRSMRLQLQSQCDLGDSKNIDVATVI